MKILKQHPILGFCCLLFIASIYLYSQDKKGQALEDYTQTKEIHINDGNTQTLVYDVHASKVENVLNDLSITLGEEDTLNHDLSYDLQANDVLEITRVTYEEERTQVSVPFTTVYVETDDSSIIGNRLAHDGENGTKDLIYTVRKVNGVETSREQTSSEVVIEPTHRTLEVGPTTTGFKFSGKLTSYGADCIGCGTRTAAGLYVTVNGVKNEKTATLSYNGGEFYVLAADRQFPFGTIVKVSNHSYGIPDPFYGIVLDRGGAVKGYTMDLFSGSQVSPLFGGHGGTVNYEIIAYGDGRTSIY